MSDKPAEDAASPKPDATPAAKEEIATDVSEVARARLSGTDKTQTAGSVASDAVDAAPGIAGTPPDDGSAPEVEAAPTAVIGKDHPGPGARGEVGPGAPTPTPPAGAAGAPPPMTSTGGGSQSAPLETNPAGTGAPTVPPTPSSVQTPATPAQGAPSGPPATVAPATPAATPPTAAAAEKPAAGPPSPDAPSEKAASADTPADAAARGAIREGAADPDKTAAAPTAPDAAATAAGAAAATAEAEEKPAAPAKPAPAARPAAAAKPGAKPAAPPKPPEPDPEEVTDLRALVPDLTWERRHGYIEVKIPSGQLLPVARMVRDLGYDYLSAVTAVDWRDRLEMLYHCYGWDYVHTPGCVVIRADLPPEANPLCPSLTAVWPGAEFQEREIYDLFGVKFVGHPDLRRILLDDNFPGHPLRKDWTFDYEYVLVRHLKYGAEGQDAPPGGEEGFRRV